MPRPKNADSEETHRKLVQAITQHIVESFPNEVTMRSCCSASGFSMGTLTYYFTNKSGVYDACMAPYNRAMGDVHAGFVLAVRQASSVDKQATCDAFEHLLQQLVRLHASADARCFVRITSGPNLLIEKEKQAHSFVADLTKALPPDPGAASCSAMFASLVLGFVVSLSEAAPPQKGDGQADTAAIARLSNALYCLAFGW